MTTRKKPSERSERAPRHREVILAIVPYKPTCSRLGVAIKSNGGQTVIAPDEARALARTEGDAYIKQQLEQFADFIDKLPEDFTAQCPGEVETHPPAVKGPNALKLWVDSYHAYWQSAYAESQIHGFASDCIIIASPASDSLDDPPLAFDFQPRSYRHVLSQQIDFGQMTDGDGNPTPHRSAFDHPPPEGHFWVFASCRGGRFQGSVVAHMPCPKPGDDLPPMTTFS